MIPAGGGSLLKRWTMRDDNVPDRWLDTASSYGPLPGVLYPTLQGLAAVDGPVVTCRSNQSTVGYQQPYSVSSLCGMGLAGNGQLGVAGVVDNRLLTSLPAADPTVYCSWLVAGVHWVPCVGDAAYVPTAEAPPVHSYPSWDTVMVSRQGGLQLSVQQEDRGKRVFLSLLRLAQHGDPLFWKKGFQTGWTVSPDPLLLPLEGYFFLQAVLEWLQLVLVERRLPASTFHAWVGTSAPACP